MRNIFETLFVIVLYKESLQNSKSFQSITSSLQHSKIPGKQLTLFVYDNSPVPFDFIEDDFWLIEYKSDINNSGLSTAYNTAAEYGSNKGFEYIFLLDQDTTFPINTIENYTQSFNSYPELKLFAPILEIENGKIMSPFKWFMGWGKFLPFVEPGIHSLQITAPVNSGLCINLKEFWIVGGYNEKVKIDGADLQFIERFKKRNTSYAVVNVIGYQDFSMFEKYIYKLIVRYLIFLKDVRNFESHRFGDKIFHYILILRRTLRLTFQTKKIIFIQLLLKNLLGIDKN